MAFISFAQNAEDVMLFRALKHLRNGRYIDIGANHPVEDSVTKAFYDRGWSGVNVEPVSQWYKLLKTCRQRDRNIQVAISDRNEPLDFYEVAESGLSTLDSARAEDCRQEGLTVIKNTVEVWTLEKLFEEAQQPETHFLKIDVEGAETQVISSGNWNKHRPWVVLVESTRPNTNFSDHNAWEPMLLDHGYQFVWFDGINRFYIAKEQYELAEAFRFPVNVLDQYIAYREVLLAESRFQLILDMEWKQADFQTELANAKSAINSANVAHQNAIDALEFQKLAHESQSALLAWYHKDLLIRTTIRARKVPGYCKRRLGAYIRKLLHSTNKILDQYPETKINLSRFLKRHPSFVALLERFSGRSFWSLNQVLVENTNDPVSQSAAVQKILDNKNQDNP